MKYLTVGDLKRILMDYEDEIIPVILHYGKSHYAPLEEDGISLEESPYFPDGDIEFEETTKFLKIGGI